MDLTNYALAPVPDSDDTIAFRYDFGLTPEGKAADDAIVTEEENGDLIIEGWAANFEGLDREGENFVPGAFQRGIKSFLEHQGALCFHHKADHGIGTVLDLREVEGKGLWMRARVDHQPESSPLRYIYNAIKKRSYRGLSVGGFFRRMMHKGRPMIADVDFTEVSVTPVAVHGKTSFAVVGGKALSDLTVPSPPDVDGEIREEDKWAIVNAVETLERIFDTINRRGQKQDDTLDREPTHYEEIDK